MDRKTIIFIAIAAIVLLITGSFLFGRKPSSPAPATIEFWGFSDNEEVWQDIIAQFQKENPSITVNYRRFTTESYEENLINRLAEGKGPDIFMLPSSAAAKHRDKIFPLPKEFQVSARDFRAFYIDIASAELITNDGQILGLPLFVDTLALFYNKDTFNAAGIAEAPKDWGEVASSARQLTQKSPAGDITKSGIAFGTFDNIAHSLEIVKALMLQYGDPITRQNQVVLDSEAIEALRFYTSFADSTKQNFSWSGRMKNSLNAFAEGTTAMALGFSEDIAKIQALNPHLSLGIAPLPQAVGGDASLTYGSYFFPTVSRASKNPVPAWQFILFASTGETTKQYLEKTGRPPARRDLLTQGTASDLLDPFYRQALIAKSWPAPDERKARQLFREAVESVSARAATPEEAIRRLREQLQLILP